MTGVGATRARTGDTGAATREAARAIVCGSACLLVLVVLVIALAGAMQPAVAQGQGPVRAQGEPAVREAVEADVSTRSVSITSSFTGTQIIVFGAVDNSRPQTVEAGLYDIVVILQGTNQRLVARKKNRFAGVWINTQSLTFETVPSYYAISSTRPLKEIANPFVLRENDIGFERVPMTPVRGWETGITSRDLEDFRAAVIRLKQRDGLYVQDETGVVFVGRNLFRTTIDLPANVPVGPLEARVYLFREGLLIDTFRTNVTLAREGLERWLYEFAFGYPLFYGIFTVLAAVAAGMLASRLLARSSH